MKTAANFDMANRSRTHHSYTVFSEQRLVQTIGNDLRAVYGEPTQEAMPPEFLRLAAMLDDKHGPAGSVN